MRGSADVDRKGGRGRERQMKLRKVGERWQRGGNAEEKNGDEKTSEKE